MMNQDRVQGSGDSATERSNRNIAEWPRETSSQGKGAVHQFPQASEQNWEATAGEAGRDAQEELEETVHEIPLDRTRKQIEFRRAPSNIFEISIANRG